MVSSKNVNNLPKQRLSLLGWRQRVKHLPARFWSSVRENNRLVGLAGMLVIATPFAASVYSYRIHTPAGTTFWRLLLDPPGLPGTLFFILLFITCLILFLSQPTESGPYRRRMRYPSFRKQKSGHA